MGVAMVATRRYFRAACHGVPGCVGPFDAAFIAHNRLISYPYMRRKDTTLVIGMARYPLINTVAHTFYNVTSIHQAQKPMSLPTPLVTSGGLLHAYS